MRSIAEYEWVPATFKLSPWSALTFCSALGNRSVLFVGDSTMEQLAAAIHNFVVVGGGMCSVQLAMALSDTLTGRNYGVYNRGLALRDLMRKHAPDIVVVGVGPHLTGVDDFDEVVQYTAAVFSEERTSRARLVWRTTLGAGCTPSEVPLVPIETPLASFWGNRSCGIYQDYNYPLMQSWDESSKVFWRGRDNTSVLDLTPLWMRFDSRISSGQSFPLWNCAHVCIPGPLRLAGRLLTRIFSEG
jgi:hypothetical protein